jgi:cob(I)alamin adenosyltransferase
MGHRLTKIYTRTGDCGSTGLGDGSRLPKDDLRIVCLGEIDELNALIGLLVAQIVADPALECSVWERTLNLIQHWLFDLGAEICLPNTQLLGTEVISFLEQDIDRMNTTLPMLKEFVLPSGCLACSQAHQARAVCRRAERSLVALQRREQNISSTALQCINRLSDWLFVAARQLQRQSQGSEVLWQKNISQQHKDL